MVGNKFSNYAQKLCKIIEGLPVRTILMGRRGFNYVPLTSSKVLHNEELTDFIFVINKYKQKFGCKFFLAGVSAGSCYASWILGEYPSEIQVEGFVSIGNPFNFS